MADLNMLLSTLLDELSEEKLTKKLVVHDMARENYSLRKLTVTDYKQFVAIITDYVRYHKDAVGSKVGPEEALATATTLLEKGCGGDGGLKAAYYESKTGSGGGLKHVLDVLCAGLRKQGENDYYQYVLQTHINPADFEQKKELARQYLERFGGLLPTGVTPMSVEEIAGTIEQQLIMHISSVSKFGTHFRGIK